MHSSSPNLNSAAYEKDGLLATLESAVGFGGKKNDTLPAAQAFGRKLTRLFKVPMVDAPGLQMIGATVHPTSYGFAADCAPASATGTGLDIPSAVMSCIGEAVEFASQHLLPSEEAEQCVALPADSGMDPGLVSQLAVLAGHESGFDDQARLWTPAFSVADRSLAYLPANLCYRNFPKALPQKPLIKLGSGCGAGPTIDDALLHGMLELIERDAIAMWWLGGRPAGAISDDLLAAAGVDTILKQLRGDNTPGRVSWFLDLTTNFSVPCVAALSCDEEGRNLACGFSARLDPALAVQKALFEMCQMEMAIHLVQLKRLQQGDTSLTGEDYKHLKRCYELDVKGCTLLHPVTNDGVHRIRKESDLFAMDELEPFAAALQIADMLGALGVHFIAKDLSRKQLGIPVVRVLATGLQPMPTSLVTARLQNQILQTPDASGPKLNIDLF